MTEQQAGPDDADTPAEGASGAETGSAPRLDFPGADQEPPGRPDGDSEPGDQPPGEPVD